MNINLHIERVVLEGISLSSVERSLLQATMEADLTRRLASGGISERLQSKGALSSVQTAGIQITGDVSTTSLGKQIITALYGGFGK